MTTVKTNEKDKSMFRKSLLATVALTAAGVLLLSGCAKVPSEYEDNGPVNYSTTVGNDLTSSIVRLPDGREVVCVVYNGYREGGVSCDWAGIANR